MRVQISPAALKIPNNILNNNMLFVERHYTKGNPEIVRLCKLSKELYNRASFLMRQAWFNKLKLPNISVFWKETKKLDCFKEIGNTKTSMQIIRMLLSDWNTFFKALKSYKKNPTKFISFPKPPKYKDKMAQVVFFNETIKGGVGKKPIDKLTANNGCFSVPFKENYKQVIITPKAFGFMIEVQYKVNESKVEKPKLDFNKICTIDIGLNILAAITLDQNRPILINGRILKSINQWYNKNQCKSRSKKRYFQIENYFHHVSKLIIDLCVKHEIGHIIIGKNLGWKQELNLGKKTNQAFHCIPFCNLIQKIEYKAKLVGIVVTLTEESYTSKASFYDNDPLPIYEKGVKNSFSGKRNHRGLYVTQDGFAINADVNGSLNIGRKVIPEFSGIRDRSLAARPLVINPLKTNGEGWSINA